LRTAGRDLLLDLAYGDEVHRGRALEQLDSGSLGEITDLLLALRHPRYWDSLEPAMRAYYRRAEEVGISGVSPDQIRSASTFIGAIGAAQAGQVEKALGFMDNFSEFGPRQTCLLVRMHQEGLPIPTGELERRLEGGPPDDYSTFGLSCLAILAIDQDRPGDLAALTATIEDRRQQAVAEGDSEEAEYRADLLEFTEGYRLWRAGDLECALPVLEQNVRWVGGVMGRLWLGQIYQELGQPAEAVTWLNTMWGNDYITIAYLELARAYEALGDTEKAIAAYAEFIEAWEYADPELQPQVQAARARLEEIVRERG
jgi:tetratricopeptide (TPR) repeat protein